MRVLVTGGAGFLGVPLVRRLVARGDEVVVFDRMASEALAALGVRQVSGDIADREQVRALLAEVQPTDIVHMAAIVGVAASVGDVPRSIRVNIEGSAHLFEAALELEGLRRLVDISSEETYGDFAADPILEDTPALPISPYGITKYTVERLGGYFADVAGLPYVAVRFSWVYGPDFPRQRLPQAWIEDAGAGRDSVLASGGDHRIDFGYVDDVVDGLIATLDAPMLRHRAYQIASGQEVTVREVARIMEQLIPGWSVEVGGGMLEFAPGIPAAVKGALDITRARTELGYAPKVSLEEGLRRTVTAALAGSGARS